MKKHLAILFLTLVMLLTVLAVPTSATKAVTNTPAASTRVAKKAPVVTASNDASTGKIKLTWKKVSGAEKYKIYYSTDKNANFKLLATTTATSYTHKTAVAGTQYFYKVRTVYSGNVLSPYSSLAGCTCDLARPAVTASNDSATGKVKLSWKKVTGATGYEIYRSTNKDSGFKKLTTVKGTSYTNSTTTAGKTYYYRVKAICGTAAATSAYSVADKTTVKLARPAVTASNDSATGKVKLSWNKVTGATGYEIYRSTNKDSGFKKLTTVKGTSYTNSTTTAGKTYYYRVKAICGTAAATSAYSVADKTTVKLARPAVTASNDSATGKVKLSWKKVTGATGYEIYRSTNKDSGFKKLTTVKATSYTNSTTTAGKTYYYRVKAICGTAAATSAYSVADKTTVKLARPAVTATHDPATGKVKLSWKKVTGATGYEVYRSTSQNSGFKKLATVKGTSYTNSTTTAGKTYYYRVKAICGTAAATSAYSVADKVTIINCPFNYFSIYYLDENDNLKSISAYCNEDGTIEVDYTGEPRKVGTLKASAADTIMAAFENSGLMKLNGDSVYDEGVASGAMYVATNDDTVYTANYYGQIPDDFLDGYAVMDACFKKITADLPEYIPEPMVMGEISKKDKAALDDILANMTLDAPDSYMISGVEKDEYFAVIMGLSSDEGVVSGVNFAPMMLTTAYSLNIVTLKDPADTKTVAKDFVSNIDWMKWVCVFPSNALVAIKGDQVLCLMGSEEMYEQTASAIKSAGWTVYKTMTNPNM